MNFEKNILAGIPTAFGYRIDADGVYVWRRREENGVQTHLTEAQFLASVREVAASDLQFISFSEDDPFRVSYSATELDTLIAALGV